MQRDEHQHGDAGVYASGSQHELRGAELRGVEHVQRRRQCLLDDGYTIEDGDELQLQLREWAVRGVHEHGDAVVCADTSKPLCAHQLRLMGKLRRLQ